MQLVSTVTLGSAASSIEFTSIPQTGTDLLLVVSARLSGGFFDPYFAPFAVYVNNATSATGRFLAAKNGSVSSASYSSGADGFYVNTDASTSNTFSSGQIYFSNYTSTVAKSVSKDAVTENNSSNVALTIGADSLNTTSPITSIQFFTNVGSFVQNTTASLYIITKA
jgi:hypothetical protein